MEALYQRGEALIPGPATGSPWSSETQHGGPASALLAHALESVVDPTLRCCRLTIDLSRPLPKKPVTTDVEPLRVGRRIAVIDASLACSGRVTSRARGLFLRPSTSALFESPDAVILSVDDARPGRLVDLSKGTPPGFHSSVEVRWVESDGMRQAAWFRLPMAVIEGEPVTPLMRAAAVSDFGNALARRGSGSRSAGGNAATRSGFVNADLTLHLARPAVGEWIGLRLDRLVERDGLSYGQTALFDHQGQFGRCTQTRLGV